MLMPLKCRSYSPRGSFDCSHHSDSGSVAGDRGGGRTEGGEGPEGRRRHHQRIVDCPSASLPSDPQPDLDGEELDDHLPNASRLHRRIHEMTLIHGQGHIRTRTHTHGYTRTQTLYARTRTVKRNDTHEHIQRHSQPHINILTHI